MSNFLLIKHYCYQIDWLITDCLQAMSLSGSSEQNITWTNLFYGSVIIEFSMSAYDVIRLRFSLMDMVSNCTIGIYCCMRKQPGFLISFIWSIQNTSNKNCATPIKGAGR